MKSSLLKYSFLILTFLIIICSVLTACKKEPEPTDITVGENGTFDYKIIYGKNNNLGSRWATGTVRSFVYNSFGVEVKPEDDSVTQTEHELLVGETNRQLSIDLKTAAMDGKTDEDDVWALAYREGKLAVYSNCQAGFERAMALLESEYLKDGKLVVPSELWSIHAYTKAQKDADASAKEEAEREEQLNALRKMNAAFTQSQFGEYKPMIGENGHLAKSPYAAPPVYPEKGQHPRLLLNKSDVQTVRELLKNPEYAELAELFWSLADGDCNYGVLEDQYKNGKVYRWNNGYLHMMVAKAMAYLVTGDELYALEAIISVKNAMLTYLMIPEVDSDVYSGGSNVIYATSMVYDWCYDVLTEDDKKQILAGIPNLCISTMEISYPPTNMGHVVGHGTGPQFLRDMMFMATAFCDEAPDWWELIVGRYFEEYLPVANASFGQGWASQGTANYAYHKVEVQMWAAACVYTATGKIVLNDEANNCAYFLLSHAMTGDGLFFETGDGPRTGKGATRSWEYGAYILASALYKDSLVFANAKAKSEAFSKYVPTSITNPSPAQLLAIMSVYLREGKDTGEDRYGKMPLIQYFDGPAGQMTVRDSWTRDDAASVLMKIGTMTMGNHDCYDHGTFQIYYKGLLACTSGSYKKYGGNIHKYYLQATISANGLLIFNPALSDSEPVYTQNSDGTSKLSNAKRYYYSGSQEMRGEPSGLNNWLSGKYNMAEMKGASSGYFKDGSAEFGYVAGDLTNAYSAQTVDHVERRMLTVYTRDPEFPMVFLTYDVITAKDESFEKTYLVHTVTNPSVNEDELSATIVNGDGKMYVHSVFGGDSIQKIGGEGYAYWINGKNCTDEYTDGDSSDKIWGRIEIKAGGELTSRLLTAMYVTDASNNKTLAMDKFESDTTHSVKIKDIIATFVKSEELAYKELSFETEGNGLYRYYLSGVEAGTWTVKVDGATITQAKSKEGEGFISFVAPAGAVSVTPASDVSGSNGGKIQYVLDGGTLPEDAKYVYTNGEATPLPESAVKNNAVFKGWYTSSSFEPDTLVTEVPIGTTGTFKVYARWEKIYVDEDFSENSINTQASTATKGGIAYSGDGKPGSSFATLTDANGVPYLLWVKGEKDPSISLTTENGDIASSAASDLCISYTLKLAKDGSNPLPSITVRVIAEHTVSGVKLSPTQKIDILGILSDGSVKFDGALVTTLTADEITTLSFVVDYKNLQIRLHDASKKLIATKKIVIPTETEATTGEELKGCMTKYLLNVYASTKSDGEGNAIRIYGIRAEDADAFSTSTPAITKQIVYTLDGGTLPDDAPKVFSGTEKVVLPVPVKTGFVFGGWYTEPNFISNSRITEILPSDLDSFTVYAKWYNVLIDEDYSKTQLNLQAQTDMVNGINYSFNNKTGASCITVQETNESYLVWTKGTMDPAINLKGADINLTNTKEGVISFTFKLSKNGNDPLPNMTVQFVAGRDVDKNSLNPTAKIIAFVVRDGVAYLGASAKEEMKLFTITDEITEIRFVADFDNLELRAYNSSKELITLKFEIPSSTKAENGRELMRCCYTRILNVRLESSDENRSLRIYGIRVAEGDENYI